MKHIKSVERKALKKDINEELMPAAWHLIDGGIAGCKEMRKKYIQCLLKYYKSVRR